MRIVRLYSDGCRAEHRVDQTGELLVELYAAELEELAGALAALGDHAGIEQCLEVVARSRLRHRHDDRAAAELATLTARKLTDDLEPDRVGESLQDMQPVGFGDSG